MRATCPRHLTQYHTAMSSNNKTKNHTIYSADVHKNIAKLGTSILRSPSKFWLSLQELKVTAFWKVTSCSFVRKYQS
jgi:hypothetical protein